MLGSCPRENEVKVLLERGQWPAATGAELQAHVKGCRSCGDLVLVTMAFQIARIEAVGAAKLDSPGVLWWKAQLRRRNEAVERIGRPILGAQIFALAVNLVLAVALVVWQARHGLEWLNRLEQLSLSGVFHLDFLRTSTVAGTGWSSILTPIVLIPALATLVLVGGVAVYLASEKQ